MTKPTTSMDPTQIKILLDTSAALAFGRSQHVADMITSLGDEGPHARFGVSPLVLAAAWRDAENRIAQDCLLDLVLHPRYQSIPVTEYHVLRDSVLTTAGSMDSPWNTWAHLERADRVHTMVLALDHRCQILTARPDDYAMHGITIRIPADGDDWPDDDYWPL